MPVSRPDRIRHRGIRNGKRGRFAIGFNNLNIEIALATGIVQIVDHEGTRRHAGLINNAIQLPDDNPGTGGGHTANFGRITTPALRTHPFIGSELNAIIRKAAKLRTFCIAVAQCQQTVQRFNGALKPGSDRCVANIAAGNVIVDKPQIALMAQLPVINISARRDATPEILVSVTGSAIFRPAIIGVMPDEKGGDPFIPFGDGNISLGR